MFTSGFAQRLTHAVAAKPKRSARLGGDANRVGLAALAVALVAFFELEAGDFASLDNFQSILLSSSALLIVGITTGILLISGNVDLSIGGMYAVTTVVTGVVVHDTQNVLLGIAIGPALGLTLGLVNGVLVRALTISPLIVTLGALSIYRGLAYVLANDGGSVFDFPAGFTEFGQWYVLEVSIQVWIAVAFFGIASTVLMRTVAGVRTFAIGGNKEAVRQNGINVDRHVLVLYGVNGFAVGLVGMLAAAQVGSASGSTGLNFEFDVLTAVILGGVAFAGGTGRPIGIFVGVVTIGILNAGMIFVGLQDFYQQIAKGATLLLALGADQLLARRRGRAAAAPQGAAASGDATDGLAAPASDASRQDRPAGDAVLVCEGISKRYGGVWAVRDVSFAVKRNEVVCLVGDNGAGKSTLVKAITGVVRPDAGSIELNRTVLTAGDPSEARELGLGTVFQDLALCPNLGTSLNLVLGAEPRRLGRGPLAWIDYGKADATATRRLQRLGVALDDLNRPVISLSGGQRQSVAIARVATDELALAVLDEPTAALGVAQTQRTLELVRALADQGAGVVMISHDVESVLAVADRVVVLRLGEVVFEGPARELSSSDLVHLMAGFDVREPAAGATLRHEWAE